MNTTETVASYRASQSRRRADALKSDEVISKYLEGMTRRGELLPGAAPIILDQVFGRVAGRPAMNSGTAREMFERGFAYVHEGEGKKYLNVRPVDGHPDPEFKTVLNRLGVPVNVTEHLYTNHAAALAGRTGPSLARSLVYLLAEHDGGRHLGVTPEPTPEPVGALRPYASVNPILPPDPSSRF